VFVAKLKEMVDVLTQQKNTEKRDRINLGKRIYDTVNDFTKIPSPLIATAPQNHFEIIFELSCE
jgi:hypothetical protein